MDDQIGIIVKKKSKMRCLIVMSEITLYFQLHILPRTCVLLHTKNDWKWILSEFSIMLILSFIFQNYTLFFFFINLMLIY